MHRPNNYPCDTVLECIYQLGYVPQDSPWYILSRRELAALQSWHDDVMSGECGRRDMAAELDRIRCMAVNAGYRDFTGKVPFLYHSLREVWRALNDGREYAPGVVVPVKH